MAMHADPQPRGEYFPALFQCSLAAWLRAGDGQR